MSQQGAPCTHLLPLGEGRCSCAATDCEGGRWNRVVRELSSGENPWWHAGLTPDTHA